MVTKVLYTTGCSLTDGSELGNKRFNYDEKPWGPNTTRYSYFITLTPEHRQWMEEHSWPGVLGKQLGVQRVVNTGKGGGCNQRIVRRIFKDIPALLSTYAPSEIMVVVGMTNGERYEVKYKDHFFQIVPEMVRDNRELLRKRSGLYALPAVQAYLDTVDTYFTSANEAVGNYLRSAITVKTFLSSLGVRCFLFPATGWIFNYAFHLDGKTYIAPVEHERLFQILRPEWFYRVNEAQDLGDFIMRFLPRESFHGVARSENFPIGSGFHPLEEAHADWAERLSKCLVG